MTFFTKQVSTLEESINPLQSSIRDLTAEKEAVVIERDSLKNEVDRWKSRANHLIEQANRTDPDEQKKIMYVHVDYKFIHYRLSMILKNRKHCMMCIWKPIELL